MSSSPALRTYQSRFFQQILLVLFVCGCFFTFAAASASAYVDFAAQSVSVNGPFSHIKGDPTAALSVSYAVQLATDEQLFCEQTVDVRINLFEGTTFIYGEDNNVSLCDLTGTLSLSLSSAGSLAYDQYHIEMAVDPIRNIWNPSTGRFERRDEWTESDETNNTLDSSSFSYAVLSGRLSFGDVDTVLQSGLLDDASVSCAPALGLLQSAGTWNITGNWQQADYNKPGELCVSSTVGEDGWSLDLDVVSPGLVETGTINSTAPVNGFSVSLTETSLGGDGLDVGVIVLTMPDSVTVHQLITLNAAAPWVEPQGISTLTGHASDQVSHPEQIVGLFEAGPYFFHDYALPFYISADSVSLDFSAASGLVLVNVGYESLLLRPMVNSQFDDPRRDNGWFPDNRNCFLSGYPNGDIFINENGLQGEFLFGGSSEEPIATSFPYGLIQWDGFSGTVEDGRMLETPVLISAFSFAFNGACPDGLCMDSVPVKRYELTDLDGVFAEDGSLGGPVVMPSQTRWGKAAENHFTFERDDQSAAAFLYFPGSVVVGSSAVSGVSEQSDSVLQYLLGSRGFLLNSHLVSGPVHLLNSTEARKGNEFFAGLTLGPQFLVNSNGETEDGITESLNNQQAIWFNGRSTADLFELHPSCKYVLRPGGATGVFNLVTPPPPTGKLIEIYGYDLYMHRFAFRQVLNRIDERTLIDGKVDLPFPADVTAYFKDLDLTCSGDFGKAIVDRELCGDNLDNDNDLIVDENCDQVYSYWNIPIEYLSIGFAPVNPDQLCSSAGRQLSLGVSQTFDRLSRELQHTAFWNPAGEPSADRMIGSGEMILDAPEGLDGFPLQIRNGYLNRPADYNGEVNGFVNIISQIGLPLFNAPLALTHLRNEKDSDGGIIAMFTDESDLDYDHNGVPDRDMPSYGTVDEYREISRTPGQIEAPALDPRVQARYDWPSSKVLQLAYPLTYQKATDTTGARFRGIKQETAFITDINPQSGFTISTVPAYLEPKKTKISMGISTHVDTLENMALDISSPQDVDRFFNSLIPSMGLHIETYLGSLSDTTDTLNSMTGGDLTPFFRDVLNQALIVADPFVDMVAENLSEIQTGPTTLSSLLNDRLDSLKADVLQKTAPGSLLNSENFLHLYTNLAACTLFNGSLQSRTMFLIAVETGEVIGLSGLTVVEIEAYFNWLNGVSQQVAELRSTIDSYRNRISQSRSLAQTLRGNMAEAVNALASQIYRLDGTLDNLTLFRANDSSRNPFFTAVQEARTSMALVRDDLAAVDLTGMGQALQTGASLTGATLDTSQLGDMEQFIKTSISEIDLLLAHGDALLEQQVPGLGFDTVFVPAQTRLQTLQQMAENIQTDFESAAVMALDNQNNVFSEVDRILDTLLNGLELVFTSLNQHLDVSNTLSTAGGSWTTLTAIGQANLDSAAGAAMRDASGLPGLPSTFPPAAAGSSFTAYWSLFNSMLDVPLESVTKSLRLQIDSASSYASDFLPVPRSEDIRNIIVADTLNSQPLIALNRLFHEELVPVTSSFDALTGDISSQANRMIKQTVAAISNSLQQELAKAEIPIGGFGNGGITGIGLDGSAVIRQNEISRFHMNGEFRIAANPSSTSYSGSFDFTPWNAEDGPGGCNDSNDHSGFIDAAISTHDVPLNILGTSINLKEAMLGFTLDGTRPIGVHGLLETSGTVQFEALALYDMGLAVGIGEVENYLSAKCAARFDSYQLRAAFFFGKSCGMTVLNRLDPEVGEFIGPRTSITGGYVRGGVSLPILDYGCFLRVRAGVDVGAWFFVDTPVTFGGLFGGSLSGTAACLASIKGKMTFKGSKTGDIYKFAGDAWVAGGVGFCDPGGWHSVGDSRGDSWCVTADASFAGDATVKGFADEVDINIPKPSVNCCY